MGDKKEKGTLLGEIDTMTKWFVAALALGIILMVIGFDLEASGAVDAGLIFTTLALFKGALFLKVDGYVRLGLLIAAGLILAFVLTSVSSIVASASSWS